MMEKYTLKSDKTRRYHRDSTMSTAEIMLIMILFHDSGYRCLKHFYPEKVCKHQHHFFPNVVSYNRFVELEKESCHTFSSVHQEGVAREMYWNKFRGQHSP